MMSAGSMGLALLKQRRFERLLHAGLVALGIVDLRDRISIASNRIVGRRPQQLRRPSRACVSLTSSQASKCSGGQHDGHAVVQRRDRAVGRTGEDGDRIDLGALSIAPALVKPGKGDQLSFSRAKEKGAALALGPGPFIKPVGRDKTAPEAHGMAERGLLQHLLRAGVDEASGIASGP